MIEILRPPKVAVLKVEGTNCDAETRFAFQLAGAEAEIVHINEFRSGEKQLRNYSLLCLPGGFSYGDDIASGRVFAVELQTFLADQLAEHNLHKRPILGICNGFQILVQMGLLPFGEITTLDKTKAALTWNDSGRFESRWVNLSQKESACQFVSREGVITLPVAHGEGKFFGNKEALDKIEKNNQVVFRYCDQDGNPTQEYPANPNGALRAIAGICDQSGRVLGLMPHPERFVRITQHPDWRRRPDLKPQGLLLFQNMVRVAKES